MTSGTGKNLPMTKGQRRKLEGLYLGQLVLLEKNRAVPYSGKQVIITKILNYRRLMWLLAFKYKGVEYAVPTWWVRKISI